MVILGIETTCDETAAALVERTEDGKGRILSNIVLSQVAEHAEFGGVVPEIAARAHVDLLDGIVDRAMREAGVGFAQLSAVAAAAGPGLIGGVIVGLTTAKAIAMVHDTPLIAVNHLEAHALTPRLTCALAFPYCLFLASGGHTQIVAVVGVGKYVRLGTTVDDAMGEAFDKIAKLACVKRPPRLINPDKLFAASRFFSETVIGDAIKPGGKASFTTKAANVFVGAQKGLLRQIIRQRQVGARKLPQETSDRRLVPTDQLTEGVLVIIDKNSSDEVRIS